MIIDNSGTESASSLNHDALHMVEKSIKYIKGSYEVSVPWKEQPISLQNNFEMAEKRLHNLEKKLLKEPEIAQEYAQENYKSVSGKGICDQDIHKRKLSFNQVVFTTFSCCKRRSIYYKGANRI